DVTESGVFEVDERTSVCSWSGSWPVVDLKPSLGRRLAALTFAGLRATSAIADMAEIDVRGADRREPASGAEARLAVDRLVFHAVAVERGAGQARGLPRLEMEEVDALEIGRVDPRGL